LPPSGEAKLAVSNFALPSIQPYVEQQARLVLNAGDLSVNGQARYAPGDQKAPRVQFTGDVSIAKFASIDTVAYHDFAKWIELGARGIQFTLQANALSVEAIKFTGLETSLVVSPTGPLDVQALLKQQTSAPSVSSNVPETTAPRAAPWRRVKSPAPLSPMRKIQLWILG